MSVLKSTPMHGMRCQSQDSIAGLAVDAGVCRVFESREIRVLAIADGGALAGADLSGRLVDGKTTEGTPQTIAIRQGGVNRVCLTSLWPGARPVAHLASALIPSVTRGSLALMMHVEMGVVQRSGATHSVLQCFLAVSSLLLHWGGCRRHVSR